MTVEKSYFKIDEYFEEATPELRAFIDVFVDAAYELFVDFESGLLVTSAVGIPLTASQAQGAPVQLQSYTIAPGSLVGTRQFKGFKDKITGPFVQGGFITDHMEHFLNALDYGFMLTMIKWCLSFSLTKRGPFTFGQTPVVGAWTPLSPGVTASTLPNNGTAIQLALGRASIDLESELSSQIMKFVINRRLFAEKTEFLQEFVEKIAKMFKNAVDLWLENAYVVGGTFVMLFLPAGVGTPPISVAHNVN